jgi:3-deoxy-D-manno-octulosonic acid (KDO) 8-phosphate synthase
MNRQSVDRLVGLAVAAGVVLLGVLVIAGGIGGCSAIKNWHRSQKRADARNGVKITQINIQRARQQALIVRAQNATVRAKAQQRFLDAVGIRRAQDEIQKTLSPIYVQHEAIQAQERVATSGKNNTVIYVPSGTNGTPIITAKGH